MAQHPWEMTAAQITETVQSGKLKATAVIESCLARIKENDSSIKAFMTLLSAEALKSAEIIDQKKSRGEKLGRLAGVPIALKDNILVKDVRTTCSSKILENFIAPYHATVVEKLLQEDAIIIGKTNLDEFAMGSSTENSAFFKTANPWNLDCVPGGSSGGSAAAVAARFCPVALGSDTGGSIRQPGALCGLIGLKPTYGRISRYGLIAFASSLDQIGPLTRTLDDAALVLSVISGHDPHDTTSATMPATAPALEASTNLKGLRVGMPKEYFISGIDPEVEKSVRQAVEKLKELGAEIKEISLPHTKYAISVYYLIAPSEASSNLARFDGVRYGHRAKGVHDLQELYELSRGEGFGPEVKRRIMLGTYALSSGYYDAYYSKAQKARALIGQDFEKAFQDVDVIATPTTPTAAFHFGEKSQDPLAMYLSDIFTIPSNLAGNASLSMPCGLTKNGLPIGLQLMADNFKEEILFKTASALEAAQKPLTFPTSFKKIPA